MSLLLNLIAIELAAFLALGIVLAVVLIIAVLRGDAF